MIKERLKEYLLFKKMSIREFERICGLSNGVASRISPTTNPATLRKIENACDINLDWLLTGEGEMLRLNSVKVENANNEGTNLVPLINIDSVGGMWSENSLDRSEQYVDRMIPLPNSRQGDVAILQSGDSMQPQIPSGAVLHIRKVEDWREYFGYGNVYVLWLRDDRRITKLVQKYDADPQNYILCCSYNPSVASEELPRKFIREVWQVVNVLINKGW